MDKGLLFELRATAGNVVLTDRFLSYVLRCPSERASDVVPLHVCKIGWHSSRRSKSDTFSMCLLNASIY